eukprot:m.673094 g.673094  ORF g.673094 m.673094 type:complete len:463 (+) comp22778_c0_seq1:507-1895(+)
MAFKSSAGLAPSWLESSLGPAKSRETKPIKSKNESRETGVGSRPLQTLAYSGATGIGVGKGDTATEVGAIRVQSGSGFGGSSNGVDLASRSTSGTTSTTTPSSGVYKAPTRSSGSVTGGLMGALSTGNTQYTARHQSGSGRLRTAQAATSKAFDSAFPSLGGGANGAQSSSGATANKPAWSGRSGAAGESSGGRAGGVSAKGKPKLKMVNQPLSQVARSMPPSAATSGARAGVHGFAPSSNGTAASRSFVAGGAKPVGDAKDAAQRKPESDSGNWRNGSAAHAGVGFKDGPKSGTKDATAPATRDAPAQPRSATTPKKKVTRSITDLGFMDALDVPAVAKSVSPPIAIKPSSVARTPEAPVEPPLAGSIEKEEALLRQMGWGIDLDDDGDNGDDCGLTEEEIQAFTEMARVAAHNSLPGIGDTVVAPPTLPTPQWLLAAAATSSGNDLAEESSSDDESSDDE